KILLVSFNPHSIFFSDRLWNPNLLFPLGTVVLYFLCKAGLITSPTPSENGDNRQTASGFTYFMAVFLPVISLQFHLSGAVLIASVFALLMFNLKKINIRASLTGLLAGFALYVPYIISDASNGFRNSRALLSHIEQVSFPLSETARAAWYFINVCSTDITYYLAKAFWFPLEEWKFFADPEKAGRVASFYGAGTLHGGVSEAMVILSLLLTLSSFFYCVFLAAKKAFSGDLKNSPIFYFVITFIMTILSFMTSGKAFYMHYVILSLPVAIIPFAVLIERLMNTQSRLFIALAAAAVSLAAIPAVHRYYSLDEGRLGLSTLKPVAAEILEDSNGADFNVNISLDNTRASDYSMAVLAKYYFKKPWKDRKNAGIEYNIVDSRIAPDGREMKIVDIGMVRIFKYLKQ
ncbi:MAG: hypothetical protein FJ088_09435, partial [Deltaproteobacteria bacterium]|nr:hypothetical protein [Deltaproteobacteria bacterium]